MNITTELLNIVKQEHSLERVLPAAAELVGERLGAGGCAVVLQDPGGKLARRATHRMTVPEDETTRLSARVTAESRMLSARTGKGCLLACPMRVRDSVVGAIVLHNADREFSSAEERALSTVAVQLAQILESARIIELLSGGEAGAVRGEPPAAALDDEHAERVLKGIGASPGIAMGAAVIRGAHRLDLALSGSAAGAPEIERGRLQAAIEKADNDLRRVQTAAEREIDEEHALIFASHLMLLSDPMLLARTESDIAEGVSAPVAINAALNDFEERLRLVPDAYVQERIDDIDDLRTRVLAHLVPVGAPDGVQGQIVVTSRMPPSLVVELKTEGARALLTESGGATSHGVLLARAMDIPVVTGIADLLASVRSGDELIVDGSAGIVVVHPSPETRARYLGELHLVEVARREHAKLRDVPAATADGVPVKLHANVGVGADLYAARDNGAEGVGLYRTEFPFIVRDSFPTVWEQVRIYSKAYEVFPAGPIRFRILDLAGDKFVAAGAIAAARSAFHGYRSLRVLFDHPDVLRDQVQALAIAAGARPLAILIPMVTSLEELRRVKAIITQALDSLDDPHSCRTPSIGAMIEVPAAVEIASDIAEEVDFLSIGTNDLMQYTLVVDREDSRMAYLADPYHPAILRVVARIAAAARQAGKPVSVCGEIAARPDIALALVALGIDSLSVVPTVIPVLKQAFASSRLDAMQSALPHILRLSDSRSVAAALRGALLSETTAR